MLVLVLLTSLTHAATAPAALASQTVAGAVGVTTRVSVGPGGVQATADSISSSISADGHHVGFHAYDGSLVPGGVYGMSELLVYARSSGALVRVSASPDGEPAMGLTWGPDVSGDGRFAVFSSQAANLVANDTNQKYDIFVHDLETRTTSRVSVSTNGAQGNGEAEVSATISDDGRFVAFGSSASNMVSGDTNGADDIFVHDRQTGQTTRVSVSSSGTQANANSWGASISSTGRFVVFNSYATNLVANDTNNELDVFLYDRETGQTERISVSSSGVQGNDYSDASATIADGRYVCFTSYASNLVAGDTNYYPDAFVRDRQTGQTTRVSVSSDGVQGNKYVNSCDLSADGRYVAFDSWASNLVNNDTNNEYDVFLHDRQTGQTTLVSVSTSGVQGNNTSAHPDISADGQVISYTSDADNLVPADTNGKSDIFVFDRRVGSTPQEVLTSGEFHNCGLTADGRALCWGSNEFGQNTGHDGPFRQVSVGNSYNCGLRLDGSMHCWAGDNDWGEVIDHDGPFTQITNGTNHGCGLNPDGTITCWGSNKYHQTDSPTGAFREIDAGWDQSCGLTVDGTLACWGRNQYGQANPPAGQFSQVSAGYWHTCALNTAGNIDCWGVNDFGQSADMPGPFISVTAGGWHTCALKPDGNAVCWGNNDDGQLDSPPGPFQQLSAGGHHTCGLRLDGSADCWGRNDAGQGTDHPGPFAPYSESPNSPPVANDLSVTVDMNSTVAIVLAASDADGDELTYHIVDPPQHGALSGATPNLTYTPAPNYAGSDRFTYRANDGAADSNMATVSIAVLPPPPTIVEVRRQFARFFLHDKSFTNRLEVKVFWPEGSAPEAITIMGPQGLMGDVGGSAIVPGPDRVSSNVIPINLKNCPLGPCPISVMAASQSADSEAKSYDFFFTVSAPAELTHPLRPLVWEADGAGWLPGIDHGRFISQLSNLSPDMADAAPVILFSMQLAREFNPFNIPSEVPFIGGTYGPDLNSLRITEKSVFSTVDASMQTTAGGHMDFLFGEAMSPATVDTHSASTYGRNDTRIYHWLTRVDFATSGSLPSHDFVLPGIVRISVNRIYRGQWWSLVSTFGVGDDYMATGIKVGSALQATGKVNALVASVKVTVGGGIDYVREWDTRPSIDLERYDARVYTGVTWKVLWWTKSWSKSWVCEISNQSGSPVNCHQGRSARQLIEWQHQARPDEGGGYAVLRANDPSALRRTQAEQQSTSERLLLDNIYTEAEPALTINPSGGELLLVYTHDTLAADIARAYDIYYMRRTASGWSQARPVVANQQADVKPDVDFAGGKGVAVWATLDNPTISANDTPEDALPHMEIAAALFDPASGTWSAPRLLTDNSFFDFEPVVAGDGNKAVVVWYADVDNEVVIGPELGAGDDMSKRLFYAVWNGSNWTAPAILVNDVDLVGKPALALRGGEGVLVWAADEDGSPASATDREIMLARWNGSAWLSPVALTNDNVEDRLPTVGYFNSQPLAAWARVTTPPEGPSVFNIRSKVLSSPPAAALPVATTAQLEQLTFAEHGGNTPVLLWQTFGEATSGVDFAVFDGLHQLWSAGSSLVADEAHNTNFSPLMSADNRILSAYVKSEATSGDALVENPSGELVVITIPSIGQSDLYLLEHLIAADLAVEPAGITLSDAQPAPGDAIQVRATIENRGDLTHSNVGVRLVVVGSQTASGNKTIAELRAGETADVTFNWQVPAASQMPISLKVEVDPSNAIAERDETNNSATVALGLPDLAVTLAQATETADRKQILRAVITNTGQSTPTGQVPVAFYYADEPTLTDAVVIDRKLIAAPLPGTTAAVEYVWAAPRIAAGNYQLFVVVDPDGSVADADRTNNQQQSLFSRSAGSTPDRLGVSVTPAVSQVNGPPGTTAVHHVRLTNTGNVTDRFTVVLSAFGWPVERPRLIGPLEAGESTEITFRVNIPANATSADEAVLKVLSRADGAKSAIVRLVTGGEAKLFLPFVRR